MDFAKVVDTVAGFLEREKTSFALAGAFALHAYGLSRGTFDIDFVTESAVRERLAAFLESVGYETLHASSGYSNHLHPDPGMGRVDVIYVGGETSRLLFSGQGATLRLGRRELPVPRAEHLAAMKIHAMKNDPERAFQEMADIRFLLKLPGIDAEEVGATSRRPVCERSTMRSSDPSEGFDLERDLPTTAEDVAALRRARALPPLDTDGYLRFLAQLPSPTLPELRARSGPKADPAFELVR